MNGSQAQKTIMDAITQVRAEGFEVTLRGAGRYGMIAIKERFDHVTVQSHVVVDEIEVLPSCST